MKASALALAPSIVMTVGRGEDGDVLGKLTNPSAHSGVDIIGHAAGAMNQSMNTGGGAAKTMQFPTKNSGTAMQVSKFVVSTIRSMWRLAGTFTAPFQRCLYDMFPTHIFLGEGKSFENFEGARCS